jgi:hypothetical protein
VLPRGARPIILLVFPFTFAVFGERILRHPTDSNEAIPPGASAERAIGFILCALSTIAVAKISCSANVPTVLSPFPILVVLPLFMGLPFLAVAAISVMSFVAILWPICQSGRGPIPPRATILLGIATGLSALWVGAGWSYAVGYHGLHYTAWVTAINSIFVASLWGLWVPLRGNAAFGWRIAFGTLFFYWLFWFAFPYLGELP